MKKNEIFSLSGVKKITKKKKLERICGEKLSKYSQ